jgi:fucose 4-O-acetylase-like acetyltransferase
VLATGSRLPAASVLPRLHWIDWLRVAAIAGVFLFHTLRPFNADDWHVKNAEQSAELGIAMGVFWSFGLAVLFLLSGVGARFALRRRTWQQFLRERVARLLVPFVVAGVLLLSPLQAYIEAVHKGTGGGSFLDFAVHWIGTALNPLDWSVSPTLFGRGYHLWFLGFLFAISVIALPLLMGLMGRRGRAAIDALARGLAWPGATLAFALPIVILMSVGVALGTDEHDWFELFWYFAYFVVGFLLVSDDRFLAAVRRDGWVALGVAITSTAFSLLRLSRTCSLRSKAGSTFRVSSPACSLAWRAGPGRWSSSISECASRSSSYRCPLTSTKRSCLSTSSTSP